jgi:hypothetical protein
MLFTPKTEKPDKAGFFHSVVNGYLQAYVSLNKIWSGLVDDAVG